jgi:hypothetical protein
MMATVYGVCPRCGTRRPLTGPGGPCYSCRRGDPARTPDAYAWRDAERKRRRKAVCDAAVAYVRATPEGCGAAFVALRRAVEHLEAL